MQVEQTVPLIYAPPARPIRLGWTGRLACLAIAAGCAYVIATAFILPPSPNGVGTHREMGLFPCAMLATTGVPCPSCGMTTSFSWFYKGNLVASLYTQPAGALLAMLTAIALIMATYQAITARPIHRMLRVLPIRPWLIAGVGVLAAAWVWKIAIHVTGHDGWLY